MWAWWVVTGVALGQTTGPLPTVLEVVALDNGTECPNVPEVVVPRVVRTSRGPAFHQGDGSYVYGCPGKLGGTPDAKVVVDPGSVELMVLVDGAILRSVDGGCSTTTVLLPDDMVAVDLMHWRNTFYALVADDLDRPLGALLRWDEDRFVEAWAWDEDQRFLPSSMAPSGSDVLWVVSQPPEPARPRLRRLSFLGGIQGADVNVEPLPEDQDGITIEPVIGDGDEMWFRVARSNQRWTWHAQVVDGEENLVILVKDTGERNRLLLGPVEQGGTWYSVQDNELFTSDPFSGTWTATGKTVPWTCLHQLGDNVFACQVDTVGRALNLGRAEPFFGPVFALTQIGPPDPGCADPTCDGLYEDLLTDAGLDPERTEPAVCPDGTTLSDLDPGGCDGCSGTGGAPWGVALFAGLASLRRRHSRPPNHTTT